MHNRRPTKLTRLMADVKYKLKEARKNALETDVCVHFINILTRSPELMQEHRETRPK